MMSHNAEAQLAEKYLEPVPVPFNFSVFWISTVFVSYGSSLRSDQGLGFSLFCYPALNFKLSTCIQTAMEYGSKTDPDPKPLYTFTIWGIV